MWSVLGPLLSVLRGLRVLGAVVRGGSWTRVRVLVGVGLFASYGMVAHVPVLAGAWAVALVGLAIVGIVRTARRLLRPGGEHA